MTTDEQKRAAAERAVAEVADGMVVGLGSGSTAAHALAALARRGLGIRCIPTSERTAAAARGLGLTLIDFGTARRVDITIDGADLIECGTLTLVKGKGGALLREKIVASASDRMIVIADESKLVQRLTSAVVPVEIVRFGHEATLAHLADMGFAPRLRDMVSDGGNLIADCRIAAIADPGELSRRLKSVTGVIESGLFVDLASEAIIGRDTDIEILRR